MRVCVCQNMKTNYEPDSNTENGTSRVRRFKWNIPAHLFALIAVTPFGNAINSMTTHLRLVTHRDVTCHKSETHFLYRVCHFRARYIFIFVCHYLCVCHCEVKISIGFVIRYASLCSSSQTHSLICNALSLVSVRVMIWVVLELVFIVYF